MENVSTTTTTTMGTTTTTTTTANPKHAMDMRMKTPENPNRPDAKPVEDDKGTGFGDKVDMTHVTRGKKINPKTGTQTSEDDPNGVWENRAYNEIQMEQAAHIAQVDPAQKEMLADTISKQTGNDGVATATEPKPTNEAGVQDDGARKRSTPNEEVSADGKIEQGETGPEDRGDLKDQNHL